MEEISRRKIMLSEEICCIRPCVISQHIRGPSSKVRVSAQKET